MATMKEIAELAGVSRGTVDRVINKRGIVNAETEKKVLEIIDMLNYQPNKAGIALAAQKKKLQIGVLFFSEHNPFFDQVMDGLKKKLDELSFYGCTIIEKRIPFDLEKQLQAIDELVEDGIHGLILSPYNDVKIQEKIDILWEKGIPTITTNTDIPDSKRIAYVGSDYYKCGQTAAGLMGLFTNSNAKVGIITGSHKILCHEERILGFTDYIKKHHPHIEVIDIMENGDDDIQSYEQVTTLLTRRNDLTALYFTSAGVYGGCRAVNSFPRKVPLKIITFDTVPTTKEMVINGTISATICQQPELQGALSLTTIIEYLLSGTLPKQEVYHTDLSIKIKENI